MEGPEDKYRNFERELLKVNRALKTLSESNRAMIEAADESKLLHDICKIIVETGGYRLAWVGYAEHDEAKTVRPVAQNGYDEGYLKKLNIVWADMERGRGPVGTAIRTGNPSIFSDVTINPDFSPWRDDALKRGYASVIGLPLKSDSTVFGALAIYAREADAFVGEELSLLKELADNLAYGVTTLRLRIKRMEAEEVLDTERKEAERKMKQLSTAVERSSDWILIADKYGKIEYVNDAVEQVTGYKREEILGKTPRILKSGKHPAKFYKKMWDTILSGQTYTGILTNRRKDGELFEVYHTITPIKDNNGNVTHFVATSKDITVLKQMEERINFLAYHDDLTELPNRSLFADRLTQAIAKAEYDEKFAGVLFIDIDRFQLINDAFGVNNGDVLLKEIGRRLSEAVREGDTVARLGSDEFGVALIDVARSEDIIYILQDLRETLSKPFTAGGEEIRVTFSIGISIYPSDSADIATLMLKAEIACNKAREQGGNNYQFFTSDMNVKASEFILLERNLFNAIIDDEFILHYQPYFDVCTRKLVGMEALIRWQSKDNGLVPPGSFISVLEETGMIIEVGEWVLRTAVRQIKEWQDRGYPVVPVSVNLSLIQFRQKNLVETLKRILEEFEVAPRLLTLEITESFCMEDAAFTKATLEELRGLGISISIDDFGTGYCSFSYLKRLPIDNLKIDISFIREIVTDPDSASIVTAIITMAKALNLKTIAEGIETEEQWDILQLLQCATAQGFYLSKPLPACDIDKLFSSLSLIKGPAAPDQSL